jgi:hypothetical protein
MKQILTALLTVMMLSLLNGCGAIAALVVNPHSNEKMPDYNLTVQNQIILKKFVKEGYRVNLGDFKDHSESEQTITCRLMTSVHPPKDESYILYLKHAFEKEFNGASFYSKRSDTTLSVTLEELYGSSTYGDAYWSFKMRLKSTNGESLHVRSQYNYESSITAAYACEEMYRTFPLAVQKLIYDTITDKDFVKLLKKSEQ